MAVVTLRPKPVHQVFRLFGALIAILLLMAAGLGIARWRAASIGGSPYGALSAVAPPVVADSPPAPVRAADAVAVPTIPVAAQPAATSVAPPVQPAAASAPDLAGDPARTQPRVIALGQGEVGKTQPVPAAAAAAAKASVAAAVAAPAAPPSKPAPESAAKPDEAASSGAININTASADNLDHIPGGGRIGKTIVRHRPYASVQDLVDRRVLRASEFARIKARLTAN